jgi:hypothetical protein
MGRRSWEDKLGSSVMTGEAMGDDSRSSTTVSIHLPQLVGAASNCLVGGMVGMCLLSLCHVHAEELPAYR